MERVRDEFQVLLGVATVIDVRVSERARPLAEIFALLVQRTHQAERQLGRNRLKVSHRWPASNLRSEL